MSHYFAELILTNQPIIIVGGGKVALRKLHGVLECQARVTVIAPQLSPEMAELVGQGMVQHLPQSYASHQLRTTPAPVLVFAATNNRQVNATIAQECQQQAILCNVVDDPAASSFLVPAVLRRPALTLAIGTQGQSPALARVLKEYLHQVLPAGWDDLIIAFGQLRSVVRQSLPIASQRERFWQQTARLAVQDKAYQQQDAALWLKRQWENYLSNLPGSFLK